MAPASRASVARGAGPLPGRLGRGPSRARRSRARAPVVLSLSKIYLVGFDYTHNPARVGHWFEKGRGIIGNKKYNDYEKDFIQIAREYADIITVTLDGSSKHLEYITYKDLTGLEPVFKENTQLVKNNKYLKALSSYRHGFGYKIFGTKSHGTHLL